MNELTTTKKLDLAAQMIEEMMDDTSFVEETIKPFAEENESFVDAVARFLHNSFLELEDGISNEDNEDFSEEEKELTSGLCHSYASMMKMLYSPAKEFDGEVFNRLLEQFTNAVKSGMIHNVVSEVVTDEE